MPCTACGEATTVTTKNVTNKTSPVTNNYTSEYVTVIPDQDTLPPNAIQPAPFKICWPCFVFWVAVIAFLTLIFKD